MWLCVPSKEKTWVHDIMGATFEAAWLNSVKRKNMDIAILHAGNLTRTKMSIYAKERCCLPLEVFNKK